nr:MAG TPA: hypothetical protein [Caudoviricetes sp.]
MRQRHLADVCRYAQVYNTHRHGQTAANVTANAMMFWIRSIMVIIMAYFEYNALSVYLLS